MQTKVQSKNTARRRRIKTRYLQIRMSQWFDTLFPQSFRIDGRLDFRENIVPKFLSRRGKLVYELGGGSTPVISVAAKQKYNLRVIGVHHSDYDLALAPEDSYDKTILADITKFYGAGDADMVIGESILNQIESCDNAMQRISTMIKPGGMGLFYVISRRSLFARMYCLTSNRHFRKLLFRLFPPKGEGYDLSKGVYEQCSPKELYRLALANGMEVLSIRPYFNGPYYQAVFPIYVFWRIWIAFYRLFSGQEAAESFTLIVQKKWH
ncbi:MAG: hypothetical protein ACQEQL_00995 [Pseudomonadota bacterium]